MDMNLVFDWMMSLYDMINNWKERKKQIWQPSSDFDTFISIAFVCTPNHLSTIKNVKKKIHFKVQMNNNEIEFVFGLDSVTCSIALYIPVGIPLFDFHSSISVEHFLCTHSMRFVHTIRMTICHESKHFFDDDYIIVNLISKSIYWGSEIGYRTNLLFLRKIICTLLCVLLLCMCSIVEEFSLRHI